MATKNSLNSLDKRFNLAGKTAVVIGGAGHLCSTLGRALAESGVSVVLVDRKKADLPDGNPFEMESLKADVTKKSDLQKVHQKILKRHKKIDILINGAGTNAPTPFMDISEKEIDGIFASHLKATLFACQVFGKSMLKRKSGSIINFASVSSGPPLSKAFVYSVAKSGVLNLTQNLGREWARDRVRVNALRPGFFPTQWSMKHFIDAKRKKAILGHTPMGRFGKPEELVGAVLWLASDAASFVTGSVVSVDGGFTAMTI